MTPVNKTQGVSPAEPVVTHYQDQAGNDCYRICVPGKACSTVSSAHLIDERIKQLRYGRSAGN